MQRMFMRITMFPKSHEANYKKKKKKGDPCNVTDKINTLNAIL